MWSGVRIRCCPAWMMLRARAMIKNFEELKKQLKDLSSVINLFKSESVQLRLVELIFQGESIESNDKKNDALDPQQRKTRQRKTSSPGKGTGKNANASSAPRKKAAGGRKGPATILSELIDEDFFKTKRAIKAIIEHASSHKARIFKANELSGPLARFVRDGRLKRLKNADGQYEYYT